MLQQGHGGLPATKGKALALGGRCKGRQRSPQPPFSCASLAASTSARRPARPPAHAPGHPPVPAGLAQALGRLFPTTHFFHVQGGAS